MRSIVFGTRLYYSSSILKFKRNIYINVLTPNQFTTFKYIQDMKNKFTLTKIVTRLFCYLIGNKALNLSYTNLDKCVIHI